MSLCEYVNYGHSSLNNAGLYLPTEPALWQSQQLLLIIYCRLGEIKKCVCKVISFKILNSFNYSTILRRWMG